MVSYEGCPRGQGKHCRAPITPLHASKQRNNVLALTMAISLSPFVIASFRTLIPMLKTLWIVQATWPDAVGMAHGNGCSCAIFRIVGGGNFVPPKHPYLRVDTPDDSCLKMFTCA
ncbi:hypothetical protein BDZ91DRAFT_550941 [Kalaharituber pfeilii]|nr:hypothetical protein BDZ91DRAFT_550941 [Kalaharituber pfeilii]